MTEMKLTDLAEGVTVATITYWYKNPGESVKEGEDIVELVTDKATFNLPAPASGKLKEVRAKEGDEIKIGQIIAMID